MRICDRDNFLDENKMKKGDLLYFRGSDNSRTEGVGHVEMYIGDGKIFGHGSGVGGTVKICHLTVNPAFRKKVQQN